MGRDGSDLSEWTPAPNAAEAKLVIKCNRLTLGVVFLVDVSPRVKTRILYTDSFRQVEIGWTRKRNSLNTRSTMHPPAFHWPIDQKLKK